MSNCHCHSHSVVTPSVYQTLDELDFDRGVWSAALNGDLDQLKKLLDRGESPNAPDKAGYCAIHYAARAGHLDVCRLLINAGAQVNVVTKAGGSTPLHRAAMAGNPKIIRLLIDAGANIKIQDVDGRTALHRAAERGELLAVKTLLEVDPEQKNIFDSRGKRAVDCAPANDELRCLLEP